MRKVATVRRCGAPDHLLHNSSGYLDTDVRNEALATGVKMFIPKPITTDELHRAVRTLLDERKQSS